MSKGREPIRGKVARILTSRQLAFNIGREQGVTVGMKFDVLDPKGDDIHDPDTGDVLGSLYRPKVRVEIVHVEERLSVAQTFRHTEVNVGGAGLGTVSGLSRLFTPPQWIVKYETLKTEEKTWEDLDESQSYVKIGDPVVQVFDGGAGPGPVGDQEHSAQPAIEHPEPSTGNPK